MKNILVTGGSGFIGYHLCAKMFESGWNPIIVDKEHPLELHENVGGIDFIQCDIASASCMDTLWKEINDTKIDACIHLAAEVSVLSTPESINNYILTNCAGLNQTIRLCKRLEIKHFIFASSGAVSGMRESHRANNVYGLTKYFGEQLLMLEACETFNVKCLRFGNVFGPQFKPKGVIGKWIKATNEGMPCFIHGDGTQERTFVHVSDIVKGIIKCINYPYLTGSVDDFSIIEMGMYKSSILELAHLFTHVCAKIDQLVPSFQFLTGAPTGIAHGNVGRIPLALVPAIDHKTFQEQIEDTLRNFNTVG